MQNKPTADGLLKRMTSFKFVGAMAVLNHILPTLSSLSKVFQEGTINFRSIQPAIDHTLDDPFTTNVTLQVRKKLEVEGGLQELELNLCGRAGKTDSQICDSFKRKHTLKIFCWSSSNSVFLHF